MRKVVSFEQYAYEDHSKEMSYFLEARDIVNQMNTGLHKFAKSHDSQRGAAWLASAVREYSNLMELIDDDESPFGSRFYSRVCSIFAYHRHTYYNMMNDDEIDGYELGRETEKTLDSTESLLDDIEKCIAYHEKS